MRLVVFALVFLLLIAASTLADGLKITRVDAKVDYDDAYVYRLEQQEELTRADSALVPTEDNSKIDVDVFPGSNLTFTVTVENTFKGDSPEIRSIVTKITLESKKGDELEEKSSDFALEPGNDVKVDIKFYIPFDIKSETYNVFIETQGIGNHTSFETGINLKLDIKKLSHDIRITRFSLEPSTVSCSRKATLTAEIVNAGSSNEDGVALEFKAPSLGFNSYDEGIALSAFSEEHEDISHVKTANIELPSFFEAGKYPFVINLYWKNLVVFDQRTVELNVKECSGAAKTTTGQEGNEASVVVVQPPEEPSVPKEGFVTSIESASILNSPIMLPILLGNGFLIAILAVLVVFGFVRRHRIH